MTRRFALFLAICFLCTAANTATASLRGLQSIEATASKNDTIVADTNPTTIPSDNHTATGDEQDPKEEKEEDDKEWWEEGLEEMTKDIPIHWLLLGVAVGTIVLCTATAGSCYCCCCRRTKKQESDETSNSEVDELKQQISAAPTSPDSSFQNIPEPAEEPNYWTTLQVPTWSSAFKKDEKNDKV